MHKTSDYIREVILKNNNTRVVIIDMSKNIISFIVWGTTKNW